MTNARPILPPITNRLPIALRAFAAPTWREIKEPNLKKRKTSPLRSSDRTIIFDTETTVDAAQSLRFGTYQVREADKLIESGIFYDKKGVTQSELGNLQSYADANALRLIAREEFVEELFYGIGYDTHANIVGFNLPFELLPVSWTPR